MSTNDLTKCVTNDSNIPLPKRIHSGGKKSKGCAQLPELQKYIDTIIKASNDYDSEDTAVSDKEKFSKDRQIGRNTVYKGYDNKIKHGRVPFDLSLNRRKIKNKPKTPFSEAVSSGVEISNKFVCEFEDPRNWKFDESQNLGCSLEVENFFKKLYPNPYQLASVDDYQSGSVLKKVDGDYLKKSTSTDIDISKPDTYTESVIEKTNNDLVNDDIEIKLSKRDHTGTNLTHAFSLESTNQLHPTTEFIIENSKNDEVSNSLTVNGSRKSFSRNKSSNSTSNVSSRASSLESMNEILQQESRTNFKRRKNYKMKSLSSKESLRSVCKSKSSITKTHAVDENPSDSDIGKLKLLNMSDSDDSGTKKFQVEQGSKEKYLNEPGSECDMLKSSDLNELLQIYDIMNKATESFLLISSKNESIEPQMPVENTPEDKYLNEKETKEEENKAEETDDKDKTEEVNSSSISLVQKDDEKKSGKSLLNLLLEEEEEQFKFKRNIGDHNLEETERTTGENSEKNDVGEKEPVNEPEQKLDDTNSVADQKVDEVVQYLYDCLKKFNGKETPTHEEEKNLEDKTQLKKSKKEISLNVSPEKPKSTKFSRKSSSPYTNEKAHASTSKNVPTAKEIQNRYSAILNENKKPITRTRCKRRYDALTPTIDRRINVLPPQNRASGSGATITARSLDVQCVPYPDSIITTHQSCILTVESHNELGGYTEEPQEPPVVCNKNLRTAKSILPLPLKIKKSKTCAYKTLKDVLETEEKLLASEYNSKESENVEKSKDVVLCQPKNLSKPSKPSAFSVVSSFKRRNSNFVICLNSFPQNLRTVATMRPNIPLPLSLSMTDIKCWNLRPLPCYPKSHLKKLSIPRETEHFTLTITYVFRKEALLRLNKTVVAYTARPICIKSIICVSKPQEGSFKTSQCKIEISIKKYEPKISEISSPKSSNVKEEEKPINEVKEAIKETEEKVSFLEEKSVETHHNCNCIESTTLKNDSTDELEKVHDLLLRTFNLQQKLHRYLHKMTYVQSSNISCPLIQQDKYVDFEVFVQNNPESDLCTTESDVKTNTSLPLVHWCKQPSLSNPETKRDEDVKIQTFDQGTTYNPPEEENDGNLDNKEEQQAENEEDDSSSVYSFKSSNDFSEKNEPLDETTRVANGEFIRSIFKKIDSFTQSLEENSLKNEVKDKEVEEEEEKEKENRIVEYDSKVPAKVLKTVFKGRKSLTELTIGLKDVPMTKVSNISVEKTKFSPNHTKISICISKEKQDERIQYKNINNDVLHNEFSSYYFDSIRPSLSTCRTELSRLEDDVSKSSQSLNEESEDDEDDYKSAGSSIDNEAQNEEKPKPTEQTQNEIPIKNYTKHKFDFYKKMDLSFEANKTKKKTISSSMCRYKELEPIKQALTEMQIRMRGIQRDSVLNSADYYERALKLAKMSAGYCQSCGTRAVIPNDTFGYYKTLLHRRYTHHRRNKQLRTTITPNSSFYSFRSSMAEVGDRFCDLDIKHSSSYLLNRTAHSNRTVLRSSLHDMPILFERI